MTFYLIKHFIITAIIIHTGRYRKIQNITCMPANAELMMVYQMEVPYNHLRTPCSSEINHLSLEIALCMVLLRFVHKITILIIKQSNTINKLQDGHFSNGIKYSLPFCQELHAYMHHMITWKNHHCYVWTMSNT